MARASGTARSGRASAYLYRAVWRWHFYAGICVLPFVLVLAISGIAMLASEPLDRYVHSELLRVTPTDTSLAASAHVAAVANAYPNASIATLTAGLAADESVRISIVPQHAGA